MLKASVYKIALLATILCTISVAMIDQRTPGLMKLYTSTPNQGLIISINGNVGIGTMAPSTKLEVAGTVSASALVMNGAVALKFVELTSTTTLSTIHNTVLANAVGGQFTINLPAVNSCAGRIYTIKKVDSSDYRVLIDPNDTETIDGKATYVLALQYEFVQVLSNGNYWFIVNNN